jgi:hypothetical protein
MNQKIEAIVTCVDYSDCLEFFLKYNSLNFDNIIIVTSPLDLETQKLARAYNINPIVTTAFYEQDAKFNKGKAINIGYNNIKYNDWILNIDADVLLPARFRKNFFASKPNQNYLYSMRRVSIETQEQLEKVLIKHNYNSLSTVEHDDVGLGYFQLFNFQSPIFQKACYATGNRPYPENSKDASQSDLDFRDKWPQQLIKQISNTFCLHLGLTMKNWEGRITPAVRLPNH